MRGYLSQQSLHSQSRPFKVAYWAQRAWDWRIAFYLYLAGSSGGLIFLEIVLRWMGRLDQTTAEWGGWIGIGLAALSLVVLFSHLGPGARWRFWNVLRNIRKSWISRGAAIVAVLMILRLLVMLPSLSNSLPWGEGTIAGNILRIGVLVFAAAFMAYSGLVLSSWSSIAFWNTPLLPVLFTTYSFLGGAAALPIIALIAAGKGAVEALGPLLWPLLLALLAGNLFLLGIYLLGMATSSLPARESVRRLVKTQRPVILWLGVIVVGLVAPAIVISAAAWGALGYSNGAIALLVIAFAAILAGGYLLRDAFLSVGVYGPQI